MARPQRHRNGWKVRWIAANGKRVSETYQHISYKEACYIQNKREKEAEEIRRGLREERPPDKTFSELCDYWLEKRAIHKRSGRDDRCLIDRYFRPEFGKIKLRRFTVQDADEYRARRGNLTVKTIANHLTLLIAMLNAAHDLGWIERVPRIKKPRIPLFTSDFQYLRTDEEVARFLVAALDQGEHVYTLYATAIYTGLRAGELAGLHWDDVNFRQALLTVQRSFGGPTKAGDVRHVPILKPLVPLLRRWRLRHPGVLVFTNRDGRMLQPSARIFQEILHRVLKAAGFPEVERHGKKRSYVTFHGLRHTFASQWVLHGGDLYKLQKILGHKTVQMTMRYAHLAPNAFAEDHELLGTELPGFGNVVSINQNRRSK